MGTSGRHRREVPAAEAAIRLGMSRERVVRLIQTREAAGRRDPSRGWLIESKDLRRLERAARSPKARRVSDA